MYKELIEKYGQRVKDLVKQYPKTFEQIETNFYKKHDNIEDYFKTYKFWVAFYNKMYDENNIDIDNIQDYDLLGKLSLIIRTEHLINWTRNKMYEFDSTKCKEIYDFFFKNKNIHSFRVSIVFYKIALYFLRFYTDDISVYEHRENKFYIDDYMLKHIPELKQFIKKEI